jgi:multiple sugar transport system permease protein
MAVGSKTKKKKLQKNQAAFIAISLTPILVIYCAFNLLPIIMAFVLSFSYYDVLKNFLEFTGLKNLRHLFTDEVFRKSIWNTFRFVLIAVPANIVITLFLALAINNVKSSVLKNVFRAVFFLPVTAPTVGSVLVWQTLYNYNGGLFNKILESVGFKSIYWLSDPSMSIFAIILMTLWAGIGYNIVLFMAGMDSIPDMFYEAAKLDGAGRFEVFWHITLPLLSRSTLFVTVMTVLSYFQAFTQFKVMTNGGPENATRVMSLEIYDTAFKYFDLGNAASMSMVLLMIMLVITIIQLKIGKSRWEY